MKNLKLYNMITKEEIVKFLEWLRDDKLSINMHKSIADDYLKTLTPASTDEDFERFWSPIYGKKWTGSKSDAKNKFNKALKEVDVTTLIIAKNDYFSYLAVCSFDRMVMGASVFLNTTTKRWEEDWKDQANAELRKQGKTITPVTNTPAKSITDLFND
jgi:hypothetical protein